MLSYLDLATTKRLSLPLFVPIIAVVLTLITIKNDITAAMLATNIVC